ncbi:MAG: integrase domain-containing protein, partial [Gammaproteobacteria bacterium]|nr:integrase domain-containing protein [Gammaproteobacteria bacterium]
NRDGSYATQATRSRILDLIANQLHELGYKHMQARSLKPKHVDALIAQWKDQRISVGTFKNRLSALRWWANKVGKADIIARDNNAYGIGNRLYVGETSKAQTLDEKQLEKVSEAHVRLSLRLQSAFGLRREEAIKFSPNYAIKDDHIKLKASWTKGGRARTVPIRNDAQRQLLEDVKKLAKGGAVIPPERNYVEQRNRYDRQVRTAGIKNPHGLRHAYAQRRYEELTGWKAPLAGGPNRSALSAEQRALDSQARATISNELGHNRTSITRTYLGR